MWVWVSEILFLNWTWRIQSLFKKFLFVCQWKCFSFSSSSILFHSVRTFEKYVFSTHSVYVSLLFTIPSHSFSFRRSRPQASTNRLSKMMTLRLNLYFNNNSWAGEVKMCEWCILYWNWNPKMRHTNDGNSVI